MMTMDCKTCRTLLEDILLDPDYRLSREAEAHLQSCLACSTELQELRATMGLLDEWTAPEPSPYFDARVRAHLREAEAAAPASLAARLLHLLQGGGTGRPLRPALAALFAFVLLLGGGTVATVWTHHSTPPATHSPAIEDLRILDNNAQALQQLDMLDDQGAQDQAPEPQS